MKKALFIDRDGTIIVEPQSDFQIDSLEKLEFLPDVISALRAIAGLDYELVMVSNQDGLGTEGYPQQCFDIVQSKMLQTLKGERVLFDNILIDKSFESENLPTRKPNTGMLTGYMNGDYDLANSYVIGDRVTDVILANNLGARSILLQPKEKGLQMLSEAKLQAQMVTDQWYDIVALLRLGERRVTINRKSRETDIEVTLDLDGSIESKTDTGLNFFNHMLDQIVHHSGIGLIAKVNGDLHVDEHHTMEDLGIVLGEALYQALGSKRGVERYGFALPMDECDAAVLLDFGGRVDFAWNVVFTRDKIGDTPTEMFPHFFKSLAQGARCNLHIEARGENEHHKIESVLKAFARALKAALRRDAMSCSLPSSKGVL